MPEIIVTNLNLASFLHPVDVSDLQTNELNYRNSLGLLNHSLLFNADLFFVDLFSVEEI